jgi:hypothetical protein
MAEEVPIEIDRVQLIKDIAAVTRMKDLTEVFFAHKDYIESDEALMMLMKSKKDALTSKKK